MKAMQTFLTVIFSMAIGALIVGGVTWATDDDDGGSAAPTAVSQSTRAAGERQQLR